LNAAIGNRELSGPPERIRAVVTGMGAVSSLGSGVEALWAGLEQGRTGFARIERFPTADFATEIGALVPGNNRPQEAPTRPFGKLCAAYALSAGREALTQARLAGVAPERIALVLGTNIVFDAEGPQELGRAVAAELGVRGPCVMVATACAASTGAIGVGLELLASGAADVVLAGGTDALTPEVFAGFSALGLLSASGCAPFSEPPGTTLGEGAGVVVLESSEQARWRGIEPLAGLWGYGLSSDAFHETTPDPSGSGVGRVVRAALHDAGLAPADIGYVNAHGTGTEANDGAETRGLKAVFGATWNALPVSSSKSFLGHAQGAAGALELIVSLAALRRQRVPPTLGFTLPRREGPADPVAQDTPRPHRYRHALSTNAAFAGANAAVVFGLPDCPPPRAARGRAPVHLLGCGAVGPHGSTLEELELALAGSPRSGRAAPFELDRLVSTADPRRLDPSATFLTAAAALALKDAGLRLQGELRDRAGLFVGNSRISAATTTEFRASIRERGLARLSTAAFARRVLCAPAGSCSRLLGLKGPTNTLSSGAGSGLLAIALAARSLSARDDADLMVAGGFDELGPAAEAGTSEGAACVLLGRSDVPAGKAATLEVAGVGFGGEGGLPLAIAAALESAGLAREEIDLVHGEGPVNAESSGAAWELIRAALVLRRRRARTALVVSSGGTTSVAVLLRGLW
jgi:3-oxoacyl-[acyl-carrier-protein] synthase II